MRSYNLGIGMTNVKIQMTNQIQMFKCLNDSVKNPDQRRDFFAVRKDGRSLCRKRLSGGKLFSARKAKVGSI